MLYCTQRTLAAFMVLSSIVSPAAFAAAENPPQDKPVQAEPAAKSYLPPWMQGQSSGGQSTNTPDNSGAASEKSAAAPLKSTVTEDGGGARKKARAASHGRRYHRGFAHDTIIGGFVGLFGR